MIDRWCLVHRKVTLAGTFIEIEVGTAWYNIPRQLNQMWDNGMTPFINMPTQATAADVASGKLDTEIENWARAYKRYALNGNRVAYIAPLEEMDGDWIPYGMDPVNFKLAFKRIRDKFDQVGVPRASVYWVFAATGFDHPQGSPFEAYFPGNDLVDAVGFSTLNFGYCPMPRNQWPKWHTSAEDLMGKYIERMKVMAPGHKISTNPPQVQIYITDTQFVGNYASGHVGALKNFDNNYSDVTVLNSTFTGNHAGGFNGAFNLKGNVVISGSLFESNSAGGGIGVGSTNGQYKVHTTGITNTRFIANSTQNGLAGALFLYSAANLTNLVFTATPESANASMEYQVGSGAKAPLTSGLGQGVDLVWGVTPITVTAGDGVTTQDYVVDVNRTSDNANLGSLELSAGTMDPAFDPATTNYSAGVPNTVSSLVITVTALEAHYHHMKITNGSVVSGLSKGLLPSHLKQDIQVENGNVVSGTGETVSLAVGLNIIQIEVGAANNTVQTYTVTVQRSSSSGVTLYFPYSSAPVRGSR